MSSFTPPVAATRGRRGIAARRWRVDRVYEFSAERQIARDGSAAIEHSAGRHIELLSEGY